MRTYDRSPIRYRSAIGVAALAAACGGGRSAPEAAVTNARLAAPDSVVTCEEWVRRAQADPELGVDRVPAPVAFNPAPIPRRLPRGVVRKDGQAEVRIRVLVDTLGAADMRTFTVVKSTHPAFETPALEAVRQWKFDPAIKGGQRVGCRMRCPIRFQPAAADA